MKKNPTKRIKEIENIKGLKVLLLRMIPYINSNVSWHLEELAVQRYVLVHPSHHHRDGRQPHTGTALGVESYNLTFVSKLTCHYISIALHVIKMVRNGKSKTIFYDDYNSKHLWVILERRSFFITPLSYFADVTVPISHC
jgi:hypothetical protein